MSPLYIFLFSLGFFILVFFTGFKFGKNSMIEMSIERAEELLDSMLNAEELLDSMLNKVEKNKLTKIKKLKEYSSNRKRVGGRFVKE